MQSASAAPGIGTAPPSVGQVPMTDDVPTGSATVSVDVSMLPTGSLISSDEDDKDEDEDSGHVNDDDEDDEVNQHVQGVLGYSPE
jgi:hypothetical protein